ncbi:MAG: head GIN domain-containing protein [Bacteroidota bacterium]
MNLKTLLLAVVLVTGQSVFAQSSETRRLDDFRRVSVGESIELILIEGNKNEAQIEADGVDADDVQTRVSGDKLIVEMKNNGKWWKNTDVTVRLTYKQLEGVSVSSSAEVYNEGVIKANRLVCRASSSGTADLKVEVDELDVEASSSGRMSISGTAERQEVSVSSSGSYNGYDLQSEICEAKASSSGSARIAVSDELRASASSSGSIKYKGDPEKLITNSSSSGSVRKS